MSLLHRLITPALRWYIHRLSRKSLPKINGTFQLKGVKSTVKIIRDKWGVPHIYADNRTDLFFAQGFVHAQDRLWQMELNRRLATGQLSELLGDLALDTDRMCRTLGFNRLAENDVKTLADHAEFDIVSHYVKGINAYIEQIQDQFPAEFQLVKHKPKKWTTSDVLAFSRFVSFQMSYGWMNEIERMKVVSIVGIDAAAELDTNYPEGNPSALPNGIETNLRLDNGKLEAFNGPFMRPIGGSNNWSVAPEKMQSNTAFLCNDPHLLIDEPLIWYQNHLVANDFEVTGVSLVGSPLVMIGHNQKIAWGITLSFCDIQDTFIEKFTDSTCRQYEFEGGVRDATIIEETILIKDKPAHIEKVIQTHHGPIISDFVNTPTTKLSLCSMALQPSEMMLGFYRLNEATSWNYFVDACSYLDAPSLNIAYADVEGNTGYWVTGKVPIRHETKGKFPSEGWTGKHDWKKLVPFDEMPHALNPKRGYSFSCNHKIVTDDYPYFLSHSWMNGYRAKRLEQLFQAKEQYSAEDFKQWQLDLYCISGKEFAALYKNCTAFKVNFHYDMVNRLVSWDGFLTKESVGGCIYQVVRQELTKLLITNTLKQELSDSMKGTGPHPITNPFNEFLGYDIVALLRIMNNKDSWWIKKAGGNRQALMVKSIKNAYSYLRERLGKNMDDWQWGKLHQITLQHAFAEKAPMDQIFNLGPYPLGGDPDTLWQATWLPNTPFGGRISSASCRLIMNVGDWSKSEFIMPAGQSANLTSPFHHDQMQDWLEGNYNPLLWDKKDIEEHKIGELELMP